MQLVKERYYSLDIFRGATVALMILVNNPGSWSHIYGPLKHAPWHGWTPTDLVFPFFLFAVGNAMAFTMPALQQGGDALFWKKVIRRFLLIFIIGLLLNWSPFVRWENGSLVFKHWVNPNDPTQGIRILGVLQRIALAYFFSSILIYYLKPTILFYVSCLILLGYWVLLMIAGNGDDPYSMMGFAGTQYDIDLLGVAHVYKGEGVPFDPEGIISTIPAIIQVVFGYFIGQYIRQKGKNFEMLSNLLLAGVIFIAGAYIWDSVFPINKKIWTSSYVMLTTGLGLLTLGVLVSLLEFRNAKGAWSSFFEVFGKNALFIFVMSGLLPRLVGLIRWQDGVEADGSPGYTSPFDWFYNNVCAPISADPRNGSLLYALCMIAMYWFMGWVLHRNKIYIRV